MSKNRGWLNKVKVDDGMLARYFNVRKEFLMKWKDINFLSSVKKSNQRICYICFMHMHVYTYRQFYTKMSI